MIPAIVMSIDTPPKKSAGSPELVKISVLAKLSGVPAPTIKHYMREGLLPGPARRTSRNMSYYDVRLAARVQVIKELQKERFLPLKIIGEILEPPPSAEIRKDLDEVHRKQLGALEPAVRAGHKESRRRRGRRSRARKPRAEVLGSLQVSVEDLTLLEKIGLIDRVEDNVEPVYQGPELDLLEVIHETRQKGLGDLFPMEILEPYAREIRQLVAFELELFRQRVLEGGLPTAPLDEVAREVAMLGERMVMAIRARLITSEMRAQAAPTDSDPEHEA